MARVEKTVFISYRRADRLWALSVFTWLTQRGFDAFIDYEGLGPGDFEAAIIENILARAHFLILLTPKTLDRCSEPDDWIRREIEEAIKARRNIVPLMLDGFSFSSAEIRRQTTGELSVLPRYNGLPVEVRSFEDDMLRLQRQFLSIAREAVIHPVSAHASELAAKQRAAAEAAPLQDYGDSAYYRQYGVAPTGAEIITGSTASRERIRPQPIVGSLWKKLGLPEPQLVRVRWTNACRIVPTRHPTVTLFDRARNADDFDRLYELEARSNERIRDELGQIERVERSERIFGPGSGAIMTAFTHMNSLGSSFSDGSFGVFYATKERRTAIIETRYRHGQFLAATKQGPLYLPMRLLHVQIDTTVYDLRASEYQRARIFKPDDLLLSQALGRELHASGAAGLVFTNSMEEPGEEVALFKPAGASQCVHAAYLTFAWDGERFTDVYQKMV